MSNSRFSRVPLSLIFGPVAVGLAVYGGAYTFATQVKDNEAAIKVVAGRVVDTNVETGVYLDSLLPKTSYKKYPTTLQTKTVTAQEGSSLTIRTSEKARIYGEFKVKYNIDKADPNFASIYTLQKAESLEDIEDDISDYTIPAAIEVYKEIKTANVNDNLTVIGQDVAKKLQEILNQRGFSYIKIADVVPTGMGLSDKANSDLEQIVSEERKIQLLEAQDRTAKKAAEIIGAQTAVTVAAIKDLRAAGVPDSQLAQVFCLQTYRDSSKIGEPFAAGCIAGATTPSGAVIMNKPLQQQAAPQAN